MCVVSVWGVGVVFFPEKRKADAEILTSTVQGIGDALGGQRG